MLFRSADGALEEYGNIMKRIRVLAIQASNDTQDTTSRGYIKQEIDALLEEASDINATTKFNGVEVLSGAGGTNGTFTFHIGAYSGDTQTVAINSNNTTEIIGTASTNVTVNTQTAAEASIALMDTAIQNVESKRATLGAAQNKLESTVRNISVTQVNI